MDRDSYMASGDVSMKIYIALNGIVVFRISKAYDRRWIAR
jgi:hypothetical protein